MTEDDLKKDHNWEEVADALSALEAYIQENEPYAKILIAALEQVIGSLPTEE